MELLHTPLEKNNLYTTAYTTQNLDEKEKYINAIMHELLSTWEIAEEHCGTRRGGTAGLGHERRDCKAGRGRDLDIARGTARKARERDMATNAQTRVKVKMAQIRAYKMRARDGV